MNRIILACFFLLTSCSFNKREHEEAADSPKIAFWNVHRKGTNIFNSHISREDIKAAKAYGIQFVRICLDKFPSKQRDFLIGNADNYIALDSIDLAFLKQTLNLFAEEEMPVVITMLSLPGSRWNQLNNDKDDLRIWRGQDFQRQAARFWKDLAIELRNYPIIVGYNILNEPHPERLFDEASCHIDAINQDEVQQLLFAFNDIVIKSIREVDKRTPVIIDSSAYADPNTFKHLLPVRDSQVLYSLHMYEPYDYTSYKHNTGQYSYPGKIAGQYWDRAALKAYMDAVSTFQHTNKIPSNRILVGEFGCYRRQKGLPQYFGDLISIFEENNWHWAFYAFRDNWDGMDYELGEKRLPWEYWKARERGEDYPLTRSATYPQFDVLRRALR
jgi:aryl-phospho-beta-D-glucosidase BglC (GH1 family)